MPEGSAGSGAADPDRSKPVARVVDAVARMFGRRKGDALATIPASAAAAMPPRSVPEPVPAPPNAVATSDPAPAAPPPPKPRGAPFQVDHAAISRLLKSIKSSGMQATAGRIQLVHFDDLRARLGKARWTEVSGRAMTIAEEVLKARLDATDIFTRYGDVAFVIVFAAIDDAAAAPKAAAIGEEIRSRLNADPLVGDAFAVKAVTAPVAALIKDAPEPTIQVLNKRLELVAAPSKQRVKSTLPSWLGDYETIYRPALYVPKRMIAVYVALPRRSAPKGKFLTGESAYLKGAGGVLTLEMDQILTQHVLTDLVNSEADRHQGFVGVLVNYYSLTTPTSDLLERYAALPADLKRRFVVEIAGITDSVPTAALTEVAGKLRAVASHVNLRVSLLDKKLARFGSVGLNSIGCDLMRPGVRGMPPDERDAAIRAFCERAKAAGMKVHIYGINDAELLKTAIAAGATYLAGDAVAPVARVPGPVIPIGESNPQEV